MSENKGFYLSICRNGDFLPIVQMKFGTVKEAEQYKVNLISELEHDEIKDIPDFYIVGANNVEDI
jgi:hypothetical protein